MLGLDMDDTVTADPHWFAAMAKILRANGGKVWIISSRSDLPIVRTYTQDQLDDWGLEVDGVILQPETPSADAPKELDWFSRTLWFKVCACRDHRVNLMVDDSDLVISLIKRYAPVVNCWHYRQ